MLERTIRELKLDGEFLDVIYWETIDNEGSTNFHKKCFESPAIAFLIPSEKDNLGKFGLGKEIEFFDFKGEHLKMLLLPPETIEQIKKKFGLKSPP